MYVPITPSARSLALALSHVHTCTHKRTCSVHIHIFYREEETLETLIFQLSAAESFHNLLPRTFHQTYYSCPSASLLIEKIFNVDLVSSRLVSLKRSSRTDQSFTYLYSKKPSPQLIDMPVTISGG